MLLSRQEIKDVLNPHVLFGIQRNVCLYARVAVEELLKYTEKLEAREQKLIEKLEEIKQEDEKWNALNGELAVWTFAQEILKILKGEKE